MIIFQVIWTILAALPIFYTLGLITVCLLHVGIEHLPYFFSVTKEDTIGFVFFVVMLLLVWNILKKIPLQGALGAVLLVALFNQDVFNYLMAWSFRIGLIILALGFLFCACTGQTPENISRNYKHEPKYETKHEPKYETKYQPNYEKKEKQIGLAKQNGSTVTVYDERGGFLFSRPGTLKGFTSSTVSIFNGTTTIVYDANGGFIYSR